MSIFHKRELSPEEKKRRKKQRIATTGAVAAVTSAGVVMGGMFANPEELLNGNDDDVEAFTGSPIVETISVENGGGNDDDTADAEVEEEEDRRRGVRGRIKAWIWRWPVGIRAIIGVPLWGLGWVIITGATALWGAVLSPVASTILQWVCIAVVLLAVFCIVAKIMFPDLPLKKILNKRTFFGLLGGVVVIGIADNVLPLIVEEYAKYSTVLRISGSTLVLALVLIFFAKREIKSRNRHIEPAPITQEAALKNVLKAVDATSMG